MSSAIERSLKLIAEAADSKKAILDIVGDLAGYEVMGARVLVATLPPKAKSKGGIIFTQKNASEARWTGNVGLVLKMGETAFKYAGQGQHYLWEGRKPAVGEWVEYQPADGREVGIRGLTCRYIDSSLIGAIVPDPEMIDDGNKS